MGPAGPSGAQGPAEILEGTRSRGEEVGPVSTAHPGPSSPLHRASLAQDCSGGSQRPASRLERRAESLASPRAKGHCHPRASSAKTRGFHTQLDEGPETP